MPDKNKFGSTPLFTYGDTFHSGTNIPQTGSRPAMYSGNYHAHGNFPASMSCHEVLKNSFATPTLRAGQNGDSCFYAATDIFKVSIKYEDIFLRSPQRENVLCAVYLDAKLR